MSDSQDLMERPVWPAVQRGLCLRCPNCGEGKLLYNYLKVHDTCDHCGLELRRAKADDGPAYLTILIVGHIVGFALHMAFVAWRPEPWALALGACSLALVAALYLLPRMKGVVIAFQWAKRMYGL